MAYEYLCYCGLYCKRCTLIMIQPKLASALRDSMKKDGWDGFGPYVYEGFNTFWEILDKLSETDRTSPLCRGGCGDPECLIRTCASQKGLDICAQCDDYPCQVFLTFAEKYGSIRQSCNRVREIGLDAWIAEQEELARKGISYREV